MALEWAIRSEHGFEKYSSLRSKKTHTSRLAVIRVHRHKDTWQDIRSEDGAARYVTKYATKPYQKQVPDWYSDVGRFWGASRDVKAEIDLEHYDLTEAELRYQLKDHRVGKWDVLPKHVLGVELNL